MKKKSIPEIALQYLIDNSPVVYICFDKDGLIHEMNSFASDHRPHKAGKLTLTDFFLHSDNQPDISDLLDPLKMPRLLSISAKTGLPETFYFYFYECDEYIHGFGHMDAEESELMRKEIIELNRDLTNLTRELHKKNAQLKELNELKNRFLSMTTHDLRHPISTIQMYSEFLNDELKDKLSEEHGEFINIIHETCNSMSRMVNEYLNVAKIESGRFTVDTEPEDITALIDKYARQYSILASSKDIAVNKEQENGPLFLDLDRDKMGQVFENLLHNAIKFTLPGGEIEIKSELSEKGLIISISDTGSGIPKDQLNIIFEPFKQVKSKTTKGNEGSGLGLAISRKIVEAHGGKIWAESRLHKGSTFYISLPVNLKNKNGG